MTEKRIILPQLHIKLGLKKQFVKALDKNDRCFKYICTSFPGLIMEKLKAGMFDCPQIRKLIIDSNFIKFMNGLEASARCSFVLVVKNFLGNHKADNYEELVQNMLTHFENLDTNKIRIKVGLHFLYSHLNRSAHNLGDFSEEQGERLHQDIKVMEETYQGRWE